MSLENYEWLRKSLTEDQAEEKKRKLEGLARIADDLGISMANLALAWCLKNPNVSTVITGASKPEQVSENLGVLDHVEKLTPEVLNRIDEIVGPDVI